MAITTTRIYPPIPDRSHDWHAHFDWQCADDLSCEGYGETEEQAVLDLMINAVEVDDDGSEQEEIINLAHDGWELRNDKGLRQSVERIKGVLEQGIQTSDSLMDAAKEKGRNTEHSVHYGFKGAYQEILQRIDEALKVKP